MSGYLFGTVTSYYYTSVVGIGKGFELFLLAPSLVAWTGVYGKMMRRELKTLTMIRPTMNKPPSFSSIMSAC